MSAPVSPNAPDLIDRLAAGWCAYLVLAVLAILAVLPGFFSAPPLDRDESRFAQATAQMLETGDFVRISVQDEPRNKKPVGIHWLQAGAVAATTGVEAREIWAYRLPSMAGAAITVLAAFWAGIALIGRRAAFVGAALLACALLVSTEGMIAKTDSMMTAMTAVALAALAHLRIGDTQRPRLLALIVWAGIGAGILIKGPITPMVVGLTVAALGLWERRWAWMKPLLFWGGPVLAGLITLPWLIAIGIETNGAFFAEAITGDLAPKISAGGEHPWTPPGVHTVLLPLLIYPATLGLIPAAIAGFRALRAPRTAPDFAGVRFLLAWALPSFLVFEVATTKLAHYPMPTYAAFALLCGYGLARWWSLERASLRLAAAAFFVIGAVGVTAAAALLASYAPGDDAASERRALTAALSVGGPAILAALVIAANRRLTVVLAAALLVALQGLWFTRERSLPEARTLLVSREAHAALIREGLHPRLSPHPPQPLAIIGYRETSLMFETNTQVSLLLGKDAGATLPAGAAVLVEGRERAALDAGLALRGLMLAPAGLAVTGHNYSNDDRVTLQPGRIVPARPAR
jgi:4-amino-4-deoxy-L-arabinose transferase-like glycosyltransferase